MSDSEAPDRKPPRRRARADRGRRAGGRRAEQIAQHIRQHIIEHCEPGQILPSEREWAARLQVSRKTVHNALEALAEQGWVLPQHRRGHRVSLPRHRPAGTTGLFFLAEPVHLLMDPFYRQVFLGVSEAASRAGRSLLNFFGHANKSRAITPATFWEPNLRAVDSLLILSLFNRELIAHAAQVHPVVCLDVDYGLPTVSFASFDHELSLKLAVKYLLDLGHRRIGYVGRTASADPAVGGRVAGYQQAMDWAGLPRQDQWLMSCTEEAGAAQAVVARWQRMPRAGRPTALVTADLFWPLLAAMTRAGVGVPAQVSLAAIGVPQTWGDFLNLRQAADPDSEWAGLSALQPGGDLAALRPTVVCLPARTMGQWGMKEVIRRVADPAALPARQLFAPHLQPGKTTGPPPAD